MDTLEVANMGHHAIWTELMGVCQALKYLAKVAYHHYVDGSKEMTSEGGNEVQQGTKIREAGVGTSEGPSGGQGGKPEAEQQGEGERDSR